MNTDKLLNFVSRFVIIIPLIIIILALIFKSQKQEFKKENINITPTIPIKNTQLDFKKINLNGEYTCSFKTKEATQTAYIKNKKIFVESLNKIKNETDYFIFSGDCLYNWDKGEYSGEKFCGLSKYISTAEKLLSVGFIDVDTILKSVKEVSKGTGAKNEDIDLKNLTCKEGINQKKDLFNIPLNVLFKNKEVK